jgi:outer membrane immunogenic protein
MRFIAICAALALTASGALAGGDGFVAPKGHTWSGIYLGAHAGYTQGDATTTGDEADWGNDPKYIGPFDYDLEGGFGGGTLGVNWQLGALVLGLEGDLGYMDLSGSRTSESSNPIYHQDHTVDGGLYALAAGRVGLAFDRVLVYGKGGWLYLDGSQDQTTTKPGFRTTDSGSLSGVAYGGGLEVALRDGWSIKGEYLRLDLDAVDAAQTSVTDDPIGHVYENHTSFGPVDTFKIGVNYSFYGEPR